MRLKMQKTENVQGVILQMGFSKLRIPRICEHCSKPFEAKTITTRFCSISCNNKELRAKVQREKEQVEKQTLLKKYQGKIAEAQSKEFISVSEATVMFGISKDTVHRMIRSGLLTGVNLGVRLTRVKRADLESIFNVVEVPKDNNKKVKINDFEVGNCYTLSEITEKYKANPSTVSNLIKRNKIPTKQVGSFVYVPKRYIDEIFDPK